jgi:sec-independent protein translocase protein TatC
MKKTREQKSVRDIERPFIEHVRELRRRLIVSFCAIAAGSIAAFVFYAPVIALLEAPFRQVGESPGDNVLFASSIFEGFVIRLQISFIAGIIATLPVHIYNVIRFVFPALESKEKKIIVVSLVSSFLLVLLAIYYGYFQIIPASIGFLTSANFIPPEVGLLLNFEKNIFLLLQFLLVTVAMFQVPIVLELLMIMNIVRRKALFRSSRFVIIAIFIVAAVITPGDIVMTQFILAIPMILLYFLTILIAKIFGFGESDDETASESPR